VKRTRLKRKSKTPEAKLKAELWELCKQIIRKKYGPTCYTCGQHPLAGSNWQTGHFIPSAVGGANLRYDLRNLRPQCYRCNVNLSGNGAIFAHNLAEREDQEYVDQLHRDRSIIVKADKAFYEERIRLYTAILADL
jgi:hypothetical protein